MAQIALPRQQGAPTQQSSGIGSALYERRRPSNAGPVELIPNPEFTFPQRAPEEASSPELPISPNTRPMSLQAYPQGRRGSAPGLRQKSISALPDFSFNPAAPTKQITTPPHSPTAIPTTPSRPVGHRRGGSEFIGGDGRVGGSTSLLSSSPTKGEAALPPPSNTLRPGPPAGRRGHAHRRSGAISSHDLSSIMQPPAPTRSGSAPVTPLEGDQFVFGHSVNKSISQPSLRDSSFFDDDANTSRRPSSRQQRVGFSEKIEYIRPLSTISSETETSMSTVRGHSATGSLSSIVSAGTSSPSSSRTRPSLNTTVEKDERPSTAGAVLDMYKSKNVQFGEDSVNRKRPMSAVSPASLNAGAGAAPVSPRLPSKRRGFFRLEPRRSDPSVPSLAMSISDPALNSADSPLPSPMLDDDENAEDSDRPKSSSRKASLKPRKVKSWANSIISRKGKHGNKVKDRPPTPPPANVDTQDSSSEEVDMDANFEANFDVDNTVTIVTPTENAVPEPKLNTDISSWRPRELKRADSDAMSPVIDLDAALGPFNTPQGATSRGQQRGFGAHRRAMHSASGYTPAHRRTESAPELAPFDTRTSTVASTPTMADVFEEDEPEEDLSHPKQALNTPASIEEDVEEEAEEPKIQLVEAEEFQKGNTINWDFNDGLGIQRREQEVQESSECLSPFQKPQTVPSRNGSTRSLKSDSVEVVEDYEEPRTSSLTHSSDSTVTPQLAADENKEQQPVMNLSLPLAQQSLRTPDTFHSSFSSPDFRSSQASIDTPRLGTAASSMTDYRAMPSPHFGEPGPELRVSVDDVPSLTSSRSTMTTAFPLMSPRRPGERSSSLCSTTLSEADSRRRKRSSIASLSRLINSSSFGEKSKLSIEQRPHSEYLAPTDRESKKKHRRLSKLMQFWKHKDSSRA